MNQTQKNYIRAINNNAQNIKNALIHIERETKDNKNIYYESDFINKAGLHTVYYGYNTREQAPELVLRSYGECKILGVKEGAYQLESIPARGLSTIKKTIIDKVNASQVEKYLSLQEKVYPDHVDYLVLTKANDSYVQTIYTLMENVIVRMIVVEAKDEGLTDLVAKTTFTVSNHNVYSFKEYNRYLSLVSRYKDRDVACKDELLDELGSLAKGVFENIKLYIAMVEGE